MIGAEFLSAADEKSVAVVGRRPDVEQAVELVSYDFAVRIELGMTAEIGDFNAAQIPQLAICDALKQ